ADVPWGSHLDLVPRARAEILRTAGVGHGHIVDVVGVEVVIAVTPHHAVDQAGAGVIRYVESVHVARRRIASHREVPHRTRERAASRVHGSAVSHARVARVDHVVEIQTQDTAEPGRTGVTG